MYTHVCTLARKHDYDYYKHSQSHDTSTNHKISAHQLTTVWPHPLLTKRKVEKCQSIGSGTWSCSQTSTPLHVWKSYCTWRERTCVCEYLCGGDCTYVYVLTPVGVIDVCIHTSMGVTALISSYTFRNDHAYVCIYVKK